MDIKRLKYFCTVVECRSITGAAEILHMSQPPLSKRLQELEEEIGTPLFLRHARKMEPTPAGYFLYERALKLLKDAGDLEKATRQFVLQKKQTLHIGVSHLFQQYFSGLMMRFYRQYPNVQTGIVVSDSGHLETLLNNQVIDVALVQRPLSVHRYDHVALPPVALTALVHNNLLPAGRDVLHLCELEKYPLILLKKSDSSTAGTFETLMEQLHKNGIAPDITAYVSQPKMIVDLLESGLEAAALLPVSEIDRCCLKHCRAVPLLPEQQVFFPTVLKPSATPGNELFDMFAAGRFL